MARPLRYTEPGMWHHAMNRGQSGRDIFIDDEDRERFLELLGDCGDRWGVWSTGYCLMSNHYHLLMYDETGRLSRAMRHVDGVYTQWFNRKVGRDGALMRGRFRSRVVQEETYLAEVLRYIHTNAIVAGLAERAADYPWSSHRVYVGLEERDWCRCDLVLDILGLEPCDVTEFDAFVHARVDIELAERLGAEKWSPILGDAGFVKACQDKMRADHRLHQPDVRDGYRIAAIDPEEIVSAACEAFALSREQLLSGRRGARNLPRLVTLATCHQLTPATNRVLGRLFGISAGTVSVLATRARQLITEDASVARSERELRRVLAARIAQEGT